MASVSFSNGRKQGATDAQVADALWKGLPAHLSDQSSLDLVTRYIMSSGPAVGNKRSAPNAPDTSDGDGCQGRGKEAGTAGPQLEQAEMRNKKLRRDGEARNLSQEDHKLRSIMRQIEHMGHKEKAVKAGAWSAELECRVGHGDEKVGEKHRFHDAHDTSVTVGGVVSAQEARGEGGGPGGEKLENKRKKEDKYKQSGSKGKEKEEALGNRKRPMSEAVGTARNQRQREGVVGEGAGGGAVKKESADCVHNRDRRSC